MDCRSSCYFSSGMTETVYTSPKPVRLPIFKDFMSNGITTLEVRRHDMLGDLYLDLRTPPVAAKYGETRSP